jgi:hypothetical protein
LWKYKSSETSSVKTAFTYCFVSFTKSDSISRIFLIYCRK